MTRRREIELLLAEAIAPERRVMRAGMICAAVAAVSASLLLGLSGWFLTGAAIAGATGVLAVQAFNYLVPSAAIRLLAIGRTVSRYGERYYSHRAALIALATVRARLFGHIVAARDVRAVSAGDAVTRLVQDIGALEDRLVRKPALPAALAGGLVGLVLAALAGPGAALAMLILLLGLPMLVVRIAPRLLDGPARDLAEALGRLKADMTGYAQASPEVVAYRMAPALSHMLATEAGRLDAARMRLARGEAMIGGAMTLAGGLAMAAVFLLSPLASLPVRVMAVLAAAGAIESLGGLVRGIMRDAVVKAGLARLDGLAGEGEAVAPEKRCRAALTGRRLDLPVGKGRQFSLSAGDRVAIVGRSGSGKTQLLEALAGVRPDAADGIVIDGQNVRDLPLTQIRELFALSPQDALLISGTVRDNLRLARPGLRDEDLWSALETACLADEVRAMVGGLDYWLGDGGARLSGGQRKRLSIARALLADRSWLLLDEPSEGLDPATEARLLGALKSWLDESGAGLVLVTHRPALLALCTRRLDLDGERPAG